MTPERLLRFVTEWRARLVKVPVERLTEEQFGQLLTLNTIISLLQDE